MHDFRSSLAYSHSMSDLPIWEEIYRAAFPSMLAMVDHRADGWHQRAGIDRSVTLGNSKQILIDEKARKKDFGDIAIEVWSDRAKKVPGWAIKSLLADYIAYAIVPSGVAYLLPVEQLQTAFKREAKTWMNKYPRALAPNEDRRTGRKWDTLSVCVPPGVVLKSIEQCLRVSFKPPTTVE